jgi:hypothetical protein
MMNTPGFEPLDSKENRSLISPSPMKKIQAGYHISIDINKNRKDSVKRGKTGMRRIIYDKARLKDSFNVAF